MPAPLAKGIILSITLLVAAGIAIYDHPQVREWIDQSRQKFAHAFNGNGDDIPQSRPRQRSSASAEDASTREDSGPEAAERRRKAREEIMERGLFLDRRRGSKSGHNPQSLSSTFDDLVDSGGKLREKEKAADLEGVAAAVASAAEKAPIDEGLRRRIIEATGVARGSIAADPFSDEMSMGVVDEKAALEHEQQQQQMRERSTTLRGDSPLIIDTAVTSATLRGDDVSSNHDSEMLVELTPTTSVAPSMSATLLSASDPPTPTSTHQPHSEVQTVPLQLQQQPQSSFNSIQEWASATASGPASFYSPPESEQNYQDPDTVSEHGTHTRSATASVIGSNITISEHGVMEIDEMSQSGRMSTPGSWSEVGSVVSEE